MSNFDATHPDYDKRSDDWALMRTTIEGENAVKLAAETYLPKPTGFAAASDPVAEYESYKKRAQFPEIVAPTIRGMHGVIHRMVAKFELPTALEFLIQKATREGDTLHQLHERITRELLSTGRIGVLTDVPGEQAQATMPVAERGLPYLTTYRAERVINWDKQSTFFVLDESDPVPDPSTYQWTEQKKHRVLALQGGKYVFIIDQDGVPDPQVGNPVAKGGTKPLDFIPFVVINAITVGNEVEEVPLLGVSRSAINMYQLNADYRHQLYMSGQETLVLTGADQEQFKSKLLVGASAIIYLPEGATADYVGPAGVGIEAHRIAIQDEQAAAVLAGARLFEQSKGGVESGDALRIRFASQTATLTSIAKASAAGLEKALKSAAVFLGVNPDEVVVTPNLSFIDATLPAADAVNLLKLWQGGAIAKRTLYDNLQRGEIASQERDFEEEEAEIADELPPPGADNTDNPPSDGELFGNDPAQADLQANKRAQRVADRKSKSDARRAKQERSRSRKSRK